MEDKTMWQIALIQTNISAGDPDRNREVLESKMQQAAEAALKPDIIVLPEMWNTGYALEQIDKLADPEGLASRRWISEFARKFKVHIVAGSVAEKREDKVYNTMLVFDRTGAEVAAYSKIHLFGLMNEDKYMAAGDQAVTFELDGIRAGASICYDIRFPELARTLSLNGAQIMFVPAQWPHPRLQHWRTLLTARAIENQMYVIACNTTGRNGDDYFFGHSAIIDPWGEWIVEGGETEGIITGQLDLTLVHQVRERIPVFKDRRPSAYEL